jgi:hypothetical protein
MHLSNVLNSDVLNEIIGYMMFLVAANGDR